MKTHIVATLLAGLLPAACGGSSIDGPPPDVSLQASAREGKAPLQVTLSINCAETSEYTIDRFEWDCEGDGVVDLTTRPLGSGAVTPTTLASHSCEYVSAGEYSPKGQVVFKQNDAISWAHLPTAKLSSGDFSSKIVVSP